MKANRFVPTSCTRNQRGSLGVLMCSMVFIGLLGVGSFAADVSHNVTVRTELQNATDAAAMAGARSLISEETAPLAEFNAMQVASNNRADGKPVGNDESGSVAVEFPTPDQNQIGVCKVTATRQINNWLSTIFNRPTDTIVVVSTAAASRSANRINENMLFPVAVSLDAGPELNKQGGGGNHSSDPLLADFKPLKDLKIGDQFKMFLNSQQVKNACYTSFTSKATNASWLKDAVDMYAGITPPTPGMIPEASAGDTIFLQNGTANSVLGKEPRLSKLKEREIVVMPVISGLAEMNQTRTLMGWITVKIDNISNASGSGASEIITGTILKAPTKGHPGDLPPTSDNKWDKALEEFSPSVVHLISSR